jgi:hypothetical protein
MLECYGPYICYIDAGTGTGRIAAWTFTGAWVGVVGASADLTDLFDTYEQAHGVGGDQPKAPPSRSLLRGKAMNKTHGAGPARLHLTRDLRRAEDELGELRSRISQVAAFINDGAYDLTARHALAQRLGLPEPNPSTVGARKTGTAS